MSPINLTATSSGAVDTTAPGLDLFSLVMAILGNNESTSALFSENGFFGFLNTLWSVYVFFAFIISILMLGIYAYASTRRWQYFGIAEKELRDAEDMYDELFRGARKHSRLDDVIRHIDSENPNDWKLAIIEADIILDEVLKSRGYVGNTLGERLKNIGVGQLSSLNDAWEAHKIRNRIAHDGADFVLTKRLAEETINRYRRVFNEFGVQ